MNRAEQLACIHELEKINSESKLRYELSKSKQKIKQDALNAQINMTVTVMSYNMQALLYSAFNESKKK